ncbi:unnamed protein product [Lasius platythorax]|uniref:Uncharacterized protein n=1 Tax=Lasius platythorax TaxID=488582 RepID=A0AAV2ND02_9HYME
MTITHRRNDVPSSTDYIDFRARIVCMCELNGVRDKNLTATGVGSSVNKGFAVSTTDGSKSIVVRMAVAHRRLITSSRSRDQSTFVGAYHVIEKIEMVDVSGRRIPCGDEGR